MNSQTEIPDPAAVFACALSLWRECMRRSRSTPDLNLSDCYQGGDEFMRVVMRAGTCFESWACDHIDFRALDEVWPYLLEEKFGEACVAVKDVTSLDDFGARNCLEVALRLRLPVKATGSLPVPVDVYAANPIPGSEFREFRIQTMRKNKANCIVPFTSAEDPFDENFGAPFCGFYGVYDDGLLEHIADFDTYPAAVALARQLIPGIQLPDLPHSR